MSEISWNVVLCESKPRTQEVPAKEAVTQVRAHAGMDAVAWARTAAGASARAK